MFTISGFHKLTEKDLYNDGCIGNGSDTFFDYRLQDATLEGLKAKIAHFHGCKVEDLDLDACDDVGRIDYGRTENENGDEACKGEIEDWKLGKVTLYYAVYTCYVMECRPVSAA